MSTAGAVSNLVALPEILSELIASGPSSKAVVQSYDQAIAKLGAVREGVLRHHLIRADGSRRDTVVFSILRAEWPGVRDRLDARLAA